MKAVKRAVSLVLAAMMIFGNIPQLVLQAYALEHENAGTIENDENHIAGEEQEESYSGPVITMQPKDSKAKLGEEYCVTVEAEGEGLEYTWYGKDAGAASWFKSGVKDNTYNDTMTNQRAGREVYCVITDAYGNSVTSDTARLILLPTYIWEQWTQTVKLTADTYPKYGGSSTGYYSKGQTFGGILYSSTFRDGTDVLWNLNPSTYYSAVANPASLLYTVDYRGKVSNESSWAGSVCSTTALKACGYDFPYSSKEVQAGFEKKADNSINNIEFGDILWTSGHVAGVVGVNTDDDGNVTSVKIIEQASTVKVFEITAENWDSYFSGHWKAVYRGDFDESRTAPEEYPENYSIIFERGNNTYVTDTSKMLFYIPTASSVYLTKEGVTTAYEVDSFPVQTVNNTTVYDLASLFTGIGDYYFHTDENTEDICIKVIDQGGITISGTTATLSGYENCTPLGYRVIRIMDDASSNAYNFFLAPDGYTSEAVALSYRWYEGDTFTIENIPENTDGWKLEVYYDTGYGWARKLSENILYSEEQSEPLSLRYDDRYDVSGKSVEIVDAGTPTSFKVGYGVVEGTPDDAVITLDGDKIIATGIGKAKVRIDGVLYEVSVEAAPISLFMITGHSMGAGQSGSGAESVVGDDGQVYSSHGTKNIAAETEGTGISFAAEKVANNINAFTAAGEGTIGEGSALAWKWNKLTGEKVWVLNTAVGGSNLKEWLPGTTNYKNAVNQFRRAQEILSNEISAGHYTLSEMGIFYHNGANFSYKGVTFSQADLEKWYDSMWSGFKNELQKDIDDDGEKETVSFLGIIPIWTKSGEISCTFDEPAGMFMAASGEYSDIFTASVIGKNWLSNEDVMESFPEIDYEIQNGSTLSLPKKTSDVFASDDVHYKQVAYNAQGIDIANNLYQYLKGENNFSYVKLVYPENLSEIEDNTELKYGEEFIIVPVVEPVAYSGLEFKAEGNIELSYPLMIKATGNGEGKLTVSAEGKILKELNFICTGCPEPLSLRYDDRYDVSGKSVEIVDAGTPTSFKVGYGVAEGTPDDAVITLDGDKIIATGIGKAKVRIDGVLYEVSVEAAPISLLLLIGQSNMRGSEGNANQSIVCPEGMVYATYGDDRGADNTEMTVENAVQFAPSALTGEYSEINVIGTMDCLSGYPVYSLTGAGAGKIGPDSGFAYEWVKQTGEKVWVVNAAHGGTGISDWQDGKIQFEECEALFRACAETLRKEIAAGHFTLSHMAYFWCQGCGNSGQTAKWYADKYLAMHESLKTVLAFDHDSDETTEDMTFELGGIIPILYGANSYRAGASTDVNNYPYYTSFEQLYFNGPRVAQYWLGNNPEIEDIHVVCNIAENWVWMPDDTNGVSDYFNAHYENGRVDYKTQVEQKESWYTPTTPAAVHDSIHYNQIGYNEIGRESVRNALIILGKTEAPEVETEVSFLSWNGYTEVSEINASTAGNSNTLVVPKIYPLWEAKNIDFELTEGLEYDYYDIIADSYGIEGTLSVKGLDSACVNVIKRSFSEYRWDFDGTDLVSTGETENALRRLSGTTENGIFRNTRYQLTEPVVLLHDQNWALEWKMTGPWFNDEYTASKKLFCEDGESATVGSMCILVSGSRNRISIGYYGGSTHQSYGICLGDYGISVSDEHTYMLVNHINEDGSNMVYLSVDGVQIGPMTTYITGSQGDMGTESDYLSGKDFAFAYMGTEKYPLDKGIIDYISIAESGDPVEIHSHEWSEGEILKEPTEDTRGIEKRVCLSCGLNETREIDGVWQKYKLNDHLSTLPEKVCCGLNLWNILEHDPKYFGSGVNWSTLETVTSITIPVSEGDRIYSSSFASKAVNGASSGIRTTFFDIYGVAKTLTTSECYAEFAANGGYLIAPEGTIAINIPIYNHSTVKEVYLLDREHDYKGASCSICGNEHPNAANLEGKVISVLGDSISTFAGYIPVADGFNLEHLARYPQDNLLTDVNETWWMQIINDLDAKLGINDSWRGSTVSGYPAVTTGVEGYLAAMSNITQIQNLKSNGTPDFILFYGGTNDYAHLSKIGTFDPETAPDTVDLETLKWDNLADAYCNIILRLKYYHPDTEIIAMFPTYTKSYYSNEKLAEGNEMLAKICEHYGVKYVDLRYCGISVADLPDGIHPDAKGMDYITNAVFEILLDECETEAGENVVYSVTHELKGAAASKSYYKGVSGGKPFEETIEGENLSVTVTMGGKDITETVYKDGKIIIPSVSGEVIVSAAGDEKPEYEGHLQELPEKICAGTNIWSELEHDPEYYYIDEWSVHSSGKVYSVTIPVSVGDEIFATSFGKSGENGGSMNGIRVTFFDENGKPKALAPAETYAEFSANGGYLVAPEGTIAINIPMWNNSEENEIYLLDREHSFGEWKTASEPQWEEAGTKIRTCDICFKEEKEEIPPIIDSYPDILHGHLQPLPEGIYAHTNLWPLLESEDEYFYGGTNWGALDDVVSVTIPISASDRIYATSFEKGIRVTFFDEKGVLVSVSSTDIQKEFSEKGYITVPEGAIAVNIPMWDNSSDNVLKILTLEQIDCKEHSFGQWKTKVEPGLVSKGSKVRSCENCGFEETAEVPELMNPGNYSYSDGDNSIELPYRIYYPSSYEKSGEEKYPIVIFYHGAGSRGTDNKAQVLGKKLVDRLVEADNCIVIAPQCNSGYQWVNTPWGNGSYDSEAISESVYLNASMALLDETIAAENVDEERVYVAGLSMGGYAAWNVIMEYPEKFAAAIAVCGAGDPKKANELLGVAIWAFHGDKDTTVPVSGSREMVNAITELGGTKIKYTEYSGVAHDSWTNAFAEPELLEWLFEQKRHSHTFENVTVEPTCTEQGYTTYTCSLCGDSYVDNYVPALGHTYGETAIENKVEATCTEAGSYDEVVYCETCGDELSRETVVVPATGHTMGDWETVTEPTPTEPGEEQRHCENCEYSESREIPALGYKPGDINMDGSVDVMDAYYARLAAAKLITLTDEQKALGDVDGDGRITASDANYIRRYAVRIIDKLPVLN